MAQMVSCTLRISTFTLCLAALCPATAFPQIDSDISSAAAAAASPVSYVYVGTGKGVYLYDAAPNGSLSLVSGSPFPITGSAIGSNGKYFLSLGTTYLRSYPVASNGAIKGQIAQINTVIHQDASCGNPGTVYGGTIDRTGTQAYIQFQYLGAYDEGCDNLQSYTINAASGAFTFGGVALFGGQKNQALGGALVIAGNNAHAYAFPKYYCDNFFHAFYRDKFGAMNNDTELNVTFPPPDGVEWFPIAAASDNQNLPTSHMAVSLHGSTDVCTSGPPSLASYTVDSNGNLLYNGALTKPGVNPASLAINPQGNLLAVGAAAADNWDGSYGSGLQVFHFNGAYPITSFSKVLTSAPIDQIRWDSNNHLYALSNSTKKLYAYTVTSSGVTAVPGSPYTIAGIPNALVVVPTAAACSAPSSNGVHICAPTNDSTVSSPVTVKAASTVSGTIARMELWVDGVKKYTATSSKQLNITISLAAGSHRFSVFAVNTSGQKWQSVVTATVK
jgi:Big-like domain-containing protein